MAPPGAGGTRPGAEPEDAYWSNLLSACFVFDRAPSMRSIEGLSQVCVVLRDTKFFGCVVHRALKYTYVIHTLLSLRAAVAPALFLFLHRL